MASAEVICVCMCSGSACPVHLAQDSECYSDAGSVGSKLRVLRLARVAYIQLAPPAFHQHLCIRMCVC